VPQIGSASAGGVAAFDPPRFEVHRQRQEEFRQQYGPDYHTDFDPVSAKTDRTPLKPDSISTTVALRCRRRGLPEGASLPVLRHTSASTLLELCVDPVTGSARLGHGSVRTTSEINSHSIRGGDHDVPQRWDDAMRRQGGSSENSTSVS
jgi:integrase